MKFETEFNVGDNAWYMKNNKPEEVVISAIEIFFVNTNQDRITYNAENLTKPVSWLDHTKLPEGSVFKSKKDLLNSLFRNDTICKGANCSTVNGIGHSEDCIQEHELNTTNREH
jgi:hypothetical protein